MEKKKKKKLLQRFVFITCFFNETYYSELGNQIKCNPSIKEESDRVSINKVFA